MRLVFLDEHEVRSMQRLTITSQQDPVWLVLADARHSRLGDVAGAVGASGGAATILTAADQLVLGFQPTAVVAGVRDLFLYLRGSSTSRSGLSHGRAVEEVRPRFETALGPARPSPSTGAMQLAYTLSEGCDVRLDVYDIAGRRIRGLDEGYRTEGAHVALWDGRDDSGVSAPPGVYLGRMTAGSWQGQRKLVLVAR